jgi:hypothetical protein
MSLNASLGSFQSKRDFNSTIANTFVAKSKGQIGPYIRGMVDAHKHEIFFTHGDLRPYSTIVKDGRNHRLRDGRVVPKLLGVCESILSRSVQ